MKQAIAVALAGSLAVLMLFAGSALGDVTASGLTSSGQTMTLTVTDPPTTPDCFSGRVDISPLPEGSTASPVKATYVGVQFDPRSDVVLSGTVNADGSWSAGCWNAAGTYTLYITAHADDGSSVTAAYQYTFQPWPVVLTPYPAIFGMASNIGTVVGLTQLQARADTTAAYGGVPIGNLTLDFYVGGRKVCSAQTTYFGIATCSGVPVTLSAILGLGYDVRFAGTPRYAPAAAHGGLVTIGSVGL